MRMKPIFLILWVALSAFLMIQYGCKRKITFDNEPPDNIVIKNLSGKCVAWTGTSVNLSVVAEDKDGDDLEYTWAADLGSFEGGSRGDKVKWNAPEEPCYATIEVVVSDKLDKASKSLEVLVGEEFPSNINTSMNLEDVGYPYVLASEDGMVVIPSNRSVTIGRGVEILVFYDNGGIEVKGTLNIEGVEGDEVIIRPYSCGGGGGLWKGIQYSGNNARGSINYLLLSSAEEGIYIYDNADVDIENSSLLELDIVGLKVDGATASITNCKIWNNSKGVDLSVARVTITSSSIRYNDHSGLTIFGPHDITVSVQGSVIANNGLGISIQSRARPVINECSIYNNKNAQGDEYAIELSQGYSSTDSINAENNFFGRDYITEEGISEIIYDGSDYPGIEAVVDFIPFYTSDPNE